MDWYWSWLLTLVGVTGFRLAGKKVWWAWYINIANQVIWAAYAIATKQWGFLAGIPIYLLVFVPNAIEWTKNRPKPGYSEPVDPFNVDQIIQRTQNQMGKGDWQIVDVSYDAEPNDFPELNIVFKQIPKKEQ